MNMTPQGMMGAPMPQITEDMIEQAKLIADACTWEEISGVLRSDERRNYSTQIETTATAFEDDMEEKRQRTEFMGAMTQWLQVAIPAMQGNPTQAPLFKELTMFFMGSFKVGRSLEETFEDAFDQIKSTPPQPNPEAEKLKGEMAIKQQEAQAGAQAQQADMMFKHQDAQLKIKQAESEFAMKQQDFAAQLEFRRQELDIKMQELELKKAIAAQDAELKQQQASQQAEEKQFQRESAHADREFKGKELALRAYESDHKRHDMDERRQADIQDKTERRELEASFQADKVGKSTSALNEKVINAEASRQGQERDGLRNEVNQVAESITKQQAMIAEALKSLLVKQDETQIKQDETQNALLSVIKILSAPRTIKRDPKTDRAIGVELAAG